MRNVLVVDDDEDICQYVRAVLESSGYSTTIVASYAAGRDVLEFGAVDILIVDAHLPDGPGVGLIEEGAARGKKTILISGHAPSIKAFNKMRIPYLPKPFGAHELLSALERATGL